MIGRENHQLTLNLNFNANNNRIYNLADPYFDSDVSNKNTLTMKSLN